MEASGWKYILPTGDYVSVTHTAWWLKEFTGLMSFLMTYKKEVIFWDEY